MTVYPQEYFQKFKFAQAQIDRYVQGAVRDLDIAQKDQFVEVKFTYCYQALIKIGMAVLAQKGGVKVRSVMGHHVKILDKLSEILNDPDILTIGNVMRMKRNRDLYDDGATISKKEVAEYILFVRVIIDKARRILE